MNKEVVVVLSHIPWDFPCDYIKQISLALTQKAKVAIFCPIFLPTIRQLIFGRKGKRKMYPSENGIYYFYSVGLLPFQRFSFIRNLNLKLNCNLFFLQYLIKFGQKKPIFWGFSYELADILSFLSFGKMFVYDRPDQYASLDKNENRIIKLKDSLLLKTAVFGFTKVRSLLSRVTEDGCVPVEVTEQDLTANSIIVNFKNYRGVYDAGSLWGRRGFRIANERTGNGN